MKPQEPLDAGPPSPGAPTSLRPPTRRRDAAADDGRPTPTDCGRAAPDCGRADRHRPRPPVAAARLPRRLPRRAGALAVAVLCYAALCYAASACAVQGPGEAERHRWWTGLGPVLPHDTFPADCGLCHVGETWQELREDFTFDHGAETGVELAGAHARAQCLRCHNDRGPVDVFAALGCRGCHEDVHAGDLGPDCASCHQQTTWEAVRQRERHNLTRLPLTGAHAATACHRCHPGGWVGNFAPADPECVTCHRGELAATTNPPHIPLGWVDNCDRCHMPTRWNQAFRR
jgi:hypothetical protein